LLRNKKGELVVGAQLDRDETARDGRQENASYNHQKKKKKKRKCG
jgi:hypothetical protein